MGGGGGWEDSQARRAEMNGKEGRPDGGLDV